MRKSSIREEARRLVERLPATATWEDLVNAIHVRQEIEEGLSDSDNNRVIPVEEVCRQFGLLHED